MILAADFTTGSKKRPATLTLYTIENGRREECSEHVVADKGEAHKVATALGYKPWNF